MCVVRVQEVVAALSGAVCQLDDSDDDDDTEGTSVVFLSTCCTVTMLAVRWEGNLPFALLD